MDYSTEDSTAVSFETKLYSYYCKICNEHCFVCDSPLNDLPNRKNDKSKVITMNRFARGYVLTGATVYIRKKGGIERQIRLKCKGCNVSVGYYCKEINCGTNNDRNTGQPFGNQHVYVFYEVLV